MKREHAQFLILDGISGVPLGREITATLCELGHTAYRFDCLESQRRSFYSVRSALIKALKQVNHTDQYYCFPRLASGVLDQLIQSVRPSYILVIGFAHKFFNPEYLKSTAQQHRAKLLLYDTDSCNLYDRRREFIYFLEHELPIYDRIYSFSKVTTRLFRETRRLDATYLPFGAVAREACEGQKTLDVVFVGTCDLRRILLLESIRDSVTIRGNRWQRNEPLISSDLNRRIEDQPIWGQELLALLGSAKIVLNITRSEFHSAETGVSLRIFEALSVGCFLLTDYCDEIADLFDIGREIEVFRSSAELVDKVKYYLSHNKERERIARSGYVRLSEHHSWRIRIARDFLTRLPEATSSGTACGLHE